MAVNNDNEYKYLSNLINTGTAGQAAWAKNEIQKYAPPAQAASTTKAGKITPEMQKALNAPDPTRSNIVTMINPPTVPSNVGAIPGVPMPALLTAADLAQMYGITYDRAAIEKIYKDAVQANYAERFKQQDRTDNIYYDNMAVAQNTAVDMLRKNAQAAITSGANKGMQAANQLATVLGVSQQGSAGATELAQTRAKLADSYNTAMTQAVVDALTTANQAGNQLGTIGTNIYGADVQRYAADAGYSAAVLQAIKALEAQQYASDKGLEGMLAQLLSNEKISDKSLASNETIARINEAMNKYTTDKNYNASIYGANKNYDASIYAANKYNVANPISDPSKGLRGDMPLSDYIIWLRLQGMEMDEINNLLGLTKYTDPNLDPHRDKTVPIGSGATPGFKGQDGTEYFTNQDGSVWTRKKDGTLRRVY